MQLIELTESYIQQVEDMTDRAFIETLSYRGTFEDMTDIIQYLAAHKLMTPDYLQGLLWYAYGWGLVILNIEICPLQYVQTPYGPGEKNINNIYPIWDVSIIPQLPAPELRQDVKTLLDAVLMRYGQYSCNALSARYSTHCPDVLPGDDISARDIFLFFAGAVMDGEMAAC